MQTTPYRWADAHALYPDRGNKSYRFKRLRFRLRSLLNHRLIAEFSEFINQSPELAALFTQKPSYSYPLVHRFLDKRFSARQRLEALKTTLALLPPSLFHHPICFGEIIEDFTVTLGMNHHQAMEGYWALELRHKPDDKLVYLLTFGKIGNALLIAVIQGPNFEGSKELVKQLTKKCHGLRPAYLMVECMKAVTLSLGYSKLLGIPHKYQNKSRFVQSKRYVVDYDAIFSESAGILKDYWELPLTFETKPIEEISSNKRSMYRKRYAMLAQLQAAMQRELAALQAV